MTQLWQHKQEGPALGRGAAWGPGPPGIAPNAPTDADGTAAPSSIEGRMGTGEAYRLHLVCYGARIVRAFASTAAARSGCWSARRMRTWTSRVLRRRYPRSGKARATIRMLGPVLPRETRER